jgi:AcrR family transcriptional regulator
VPAIASPRRDELLERAYQYALEHGVADLSLRPLAAAVGSSPRVLLFLFGSKAGLVQALLARARQDELALLERARGMGAGPRGDRDPVAVAVEVWTWLVADEHRALLKLWVEGYARSLIEPSGPWGGFAAATVADWLDVLGGAGPNAEPGDAKRVGETLILAVLRGAMLDLLATGDSERVTAAVNRQLDLLRSDE